MGSISMTGLDQKDPALCAHCIMITPLLGLLSVASALSEKMFLFGISEINKTEDFQRAVHKFLCLKALNYQSLA